MYEVLYFFVILNVNVVCGADIDISKAFYLCCKDCCKARSMLSMHSRALSIVTWL